MQKVAGRQASKHTGTQAAGGEEAGGCHAGSGVVMRAAAQAGGHWLASLHHPGPHIARPHVEQNCGAEQWSYGMRLALPP